MRVVLLMTALVGLGAAPDDQAKAKAEPGAAKKVQPGAPAGAQGFLQTFIDLDANGDMAIERSEVPESGMKAFERLLKRGDTNSNGRLEGDELRALGEKARMAAGPVGGGGRLRAMDADGDGKVTRAEFQGPPALFDRLDKDGDGTVTMDEARTFAAGMMPAVAERFKAVDKDGDGSISREEFPGRPAGFQRLDADGDGRLSPEEFARGAMLLPGVRSTDGPAKNPNPDAKSEKPKESGDGEKATEAEPKDVKPKDRGKPEAF